MTRGHGVAARVSGILAEEDARVYLRKAGLRFAMIAVLAGTSLLGARAQDAETELERRAKTKVQPICPELARRLNLSGTVKVQVVIAPDGMVKEAKVMGGPPVLTSAALDAAKKWRFEPAAQEMTGVLNFRFEPRQ
jgi:TonB family protein